jgi:hypothetical protein
LILDELKTHKQKSSTDTPQIQTCSNNTILGDQEPEDCTSSEDESPEATATDTNRDHEKSSRATASSITNTTNP